MPPKNIPKSQLSHLTKFKVDQNINELFVQYDKNGSSMFSERARNDVWTAGSQQVKSAAKIFTRTLDVTQSEPKDNKLSLMELDATLKKILDNQDEFLEPDQVESLQMEQIQEKNIVNQNIFDNNENLDDMEIFSTAFDTVVEEVPNNQIKEMLTKIKNIILQKAVRKTSIQNAQQHANQILDQKLQLEIKNNQNLSNEILLLQGKYEQLQGHYKASTERANQLQLAFIKLQNENSYFKQEKDVLQKQNLLNVKELRDKQDEKIEFQERFKRQQLVLQKMRKQLNESQQVLINQNQIIKQYRDDKDDLIAALSKEQHTIEKQGQQIDRMGKQLRDTIEAHQMEIDKLNNRLLSTTANLEGVKMENVDNDLQYSMCIQNGIGALVTISDPQFENKLLSDFGIDRQSLFNLKFILTNLKNADLGTQIQDYFHNDYIQLYIDTVSKSVQANFQNVQKPLVMTKFINKQSKSNLNKTPRLPKIQQLSVKEKLQQENLKQSQQIEKQQVKSPRKELQETKPDQKFIQLPIENQINQFESINQFKQDPKPVSTRKNRQKIADQLANMNEKTSHKKVKNVITALGCQFSQVIKTCNIDLNPRPLDQSAQLGSDILVKLPNQAHDVLTINQDFLKILNKIIKYLPVNDQQDLREDVINTMFKHKDHLQNKKEFKEFYNTFKYENDNLLDSDEDSDNIIIYEEQREQIREKLLLFLDQVKNDTSKKNSLVFSNITNEKHQQMFGDIDGQRAEFPSKPPYFSINQPEVNHFESSQNAQQIENANHSIHNNITTTNQANMEDSTNVGVTTENLSQTFNDSKIITTLEESLEDVNKDRQDSPLVRHNTDEFRISMVSVNAQVHIDNVVENQPMKKIVRTSSRVTKSRITSTIQENSESHQQMINYHNDSYAFPTHIKKKSKMNDKDFQVYQKQYDSYLQKASQERKQMSAEELQQKFLDELDIISQLDQSNVELLKSYLLKNNQFFKDSQGIIQQIDCEKYWQNKKSSLDLLAANNQKIAIQESEQRKSSRENVKIVEFINQPSSLHVDSSLGHKSTVLETDLIDQFTQTDVNVNDSVTDMIIFKDMKQLLKDSLEQQVQISESNLDSQTLYVNNQLGNVNIRQQIIEQCVPLDQQKVQQNKNQAIANEIVQQKFLDNFNQQLSQKVAQVSKKSSKALKQETISKISYNDSIQVSIDDQNLLDGMQIRKVSKKQITQAFLKLHPYHGAFGSPSFNDMLAQPFIEQFVLQHPIDRLYYKYLPLEQEVKTSLFAPCIISYIEQSELINAQLQDCTKQLFINEINIHNSKQQCYLDEEDKLRQVQSLLPKIGQSVGFVRLSACSVLSITPKLFLALQDLQKIQFINLKDQQFIVIPMSQVQLKTELWINKLVDQIIKDRLNTSISQISQIAQQSDVVNVQEGNFEVVPGQIQSKQAMSIGLYTLHWALQKYGVKSLALSLVWNMIANLCYYQYHNQKIYIFARLFFDDLQDDYQEIYFDLVNNLSQDPVLIDQVPKVISLLVPSFSVQRSQSFYSSLIAISYIQNNDKYVDFALFSSLLLFAYGSFRKSSFQALIQIFRNFGTQLKEAQFREFLSVSDIKLKNFTISEVFFAFRKKEVFTVESFIHLFTQFQLSRFAQITPFNLEQIVSNDILRMNKSCALVFSKIQASLFKIQRYMSNVQLQKLKSAVEIVKADILVYDIASAVDGFQKIIQLAISSLGEKAPDACLAVVSGTVSALNQVMGDI
ncbi:hypothetical protein SS50377_20268 [Spironucleus salmonicida]|uniref:Uncharacterized protein n=1 Tax=Spironucleus salmonicida TaxID=348837 RepID=V6LL91_9EUKA|nr:hypothetical protein SS50377_20268 [Spironucleus salmonicida]|eukprot:EST45322.1 hypothetical protein SS50377_14899 [Spironucleus salmonicida]